jgi:hypothetical protein
MAKVVISIQIVKYKTFNLSFRQCAIPYLFVDSTTDLLHFWVFPLAGVSSISNTYGKSVLKLCRFHLLLIDEQNTLSLII